MAGREITPTQSAFLALKEERTGMAEGYGFLDEKRLILASEILMELERYEREMDIFRRAYAKAASALRSAVARHGLEGLGLYPKAGIPCSEVRVAPRSVLGVTVQATVWEVDKPHPRERAVDASPEAEACRSAFADIIPHAARLAVFAGNLERLRLEYTRTARRARALEDVLLPEIDDTLQAIEAALEELEREEALRVRRIHKGP